MQEATAEKLTKIQSLFDAGKTHSEIAKEVGYTKIESFYRYIYKYDDHLSYKKLFNKKALLAVIKEESKSKEEEKDISRPQTKENMSKAESIVALINRGMEVREVAKKKRFKTMQEMANYMKSKGYYWSSTKKNYGLVSEIKQVLLENRPPPETLETRATDEIRAHMNLKDDYETILKLLVEKKDKLFELLNGKTNQGVMPRYIIPGVVKTKSIKIVNTLESIMNDFCAETNITHKEMIEVATIEFLKKYGYSNEVKTVFNL